MLSFMIGLIGFLQRSFSRDLPEFSFREGFLFFRILFPFPANSANVPCLRIESSDTGTNRIHRLKVSTGTADEFPAHGRLRISTCFAAIAASKASIR